MCVENQPVPNIGAATPPTPKKDLEELQKNLKLSAEGLQGQASAVSLGSLSTSASGLPSHTASTASLGVCSGSASTSSEQHEADVMADAFSQAFGSGAGPSFDARDFAERFMAMRKQVTTRNSQLRDRSPPCRHPWTAAPLVPYPQRPRRWHASMAWDFRPGSEPKLRAQLFEACDSDEQGDHRLMMEMSAEEFMALPVSPWGRW